MPSIDLLFDRAPYGPGPVDLVFGDDPDAPVVVIDPVTLQSAAQITGIAQHLGVAFGVGVQYSAQITGLARVLGARYDININRATVAGTRAVWQDATSVQTATAVTYRQALPVPARIAAQWQDAQKTLFAKNVVLLQDAQRLRNAIASAFEQAQRLPSAPLAVVLQDAQRLRNAVSGAFEQATRTPSAPLAILFEQAFRDRRAQVASAFQVAHRLGKPTASGMGIAVQVSLGFDGAYQQAWPPRPGRSVVIPPPPPVIPGCYDPALPAHLVFRDAPFGPGPVHLVFACAPGTGPVDPENPSSSIPHRKTYFIVNTFSLKRVADNTPIEILSASVGIDKSSWCWSFSAELAHYELDKVEPSASGPVEVELEVNGITWRLLVEKYQSRGTFGSTTISISGRSPTAYLGSPYSLNHSYLQSIAMTSRQYADLELSRPGLLPDGIAGFTLDWKLVDVLGWNMPENTWSYNNLSAIQVIKFLAEGVGGYVNTHRVNRELLVLPGYPAPYWEWDALTPNRVIPEQIIQSMSLNWEERPTFNGVHVSGEQVGSFTAFVKRTGTAGDKQDTPYVNPMISHPDAARAMGVSLLSAGGIQAMMDLEMPMTSELGLMTPGMLVEVTKDLSASWRGLIRSTQVAATWGDSDGLTVSQSLSIERHYGGL